MKYTRNINVKKYSSIEQIYDSVNNDPKRPGFQIVYLDKTSAVSKAAAWQLYLTKAGFQDITFKYPKIDDTTYYAIIIEATPEQATALKICF